MKHRYIGTRMSGSKDLFTRRALYIENDRRDGSLMIWSEDMGSGNTNDMGKLRLSCDDAAHLVVDLFAYLVHQAPAVLPRILHAVMDRRAS